MRLASLGRRLSDLPPPTEEPPTASIIAVTWGSSELRSLLASLLTIGFAIQGPFSPQEAQGRAGERGSVLLLDLRAGFPSAEDLAELTTIAPPSLAIVHRHPAAAHTALIGGVTAVLADPVTPELVATQLRNLARFSGGRPGADLITLGDLEVNASTRSITWKEQPVHLSPAQFRILWALCSQPNHVHPAEELVKAALGYSVPSAEAAGILKIHVRRIRAALEALDWSAGEVLQNVRGFGYMISFRAG